MFVKKKIIYDSVSNPSRKLNNVSIKEEVIYSLFGLVFYRVLSI
jgi:hypothetical protein